MGEPLLLRPYASAALTARHEDSNLLTLYASYRKLHVTHFLI